jgi:putative transposase
VHGLQNLPIPLPPSVQDLDVILGRVGTGIVQHYGLQNAKLRYNSEALGALRREFGLNIRLEFIWNEEDLGSIYVKHPTSGEHIEVPAIRLRYASKLTLHQHKAIQLLKRKQLPGREDEEASIETKVMIQEKLSQKQTRRSMKITKSDARQMYGAHDTNQLSRVSPNSRGQSIKFNEPKVSSDPADCNGTGETFDPFPVDILTADRQIENVKSTIKNLLGGR